MSRTAIAILSTENLLHNIKVIKAQAKNSKIIAMVKANAYGHGLRSVSLRLEKHVDLLGVASIDEALALRKANVHGQILLMEGVFEPNELMIAAAEGFHVVFHDAVQIEWLLRASLSVPINAWLKVDTGMGRLGFSINEAAIIYNKLINNPQIKLPLKVMSHLACAEMKTHELNIKQIAVFKDFMHNLKGEFSLCNSAGIFNFPSEHYDYVRPGIMLYGVSPFLEQTSADLGLKPVMTLQTSIITIKEMRAGSAIGYGGRFICPHDMRVGIVAFGYGDGYPRTAKDGTPVLVNNIRCKLIGRVSMDMLAVDLSTCDAVRVGDPVILWGNNLLIEEVALYTENSVYDLLTGIQNRVKFYWTSLP